MLEEGSEFGTPYYTYIKAQNLRLYLIRIFIMCFVSVRAVYDLCQGE